MYYKVNKGGMELGDLARVLMYGDLHLSSKGYGAHRNYPKETLHYLKTITEYTEKYRATHLIGLGDLSFGRFNTLEYRLAVEAELIKQNELTDGNRYEVKGNHDSATYGMTEYEYYVSKGLIKPSTNITIGRVNISMVDSGKSSTANIIDPSNQDELNVVLAHDYFKFEDTRMPDYGAAILLDNFTRWFGVDFLFLGHIHSFEMFEGLVVKDGHGHRMAVTILGSPSRPSYREGLMDEVGHLALLTIRDNGEVQYDLLEMPLWSLEESFNIELKEKEKEKQIQREKSIDISDIVENLNTHNSTMGNPEDIIRALEGIDEKYKQKAIELLKEGMA